jgi:thiamine biosynthesis protein ThiI
MEKYALSIHYNEIALKGKLRSKFEKMLRDSIRYTTTVMPSTENGRLLMQGYDPSAKELLKLVPGISWIGEATIIERDKDLLKSIIKSLISRYGSTLDFDVKRIDKNFENTSLELKNSLAKELGIRFSPQGYKVRIEIMPKEYIINYAIERGIGGVPVGSAGRVLSLFSGGIDSATVPFEMMKRGCLTDLVHVYALADEEQALKSKVGEIIKKISSIEPVTIYLVPFHVFSLKATDINPRYELVFFKRFLLKLAEELCYRYEYKAIASGDAISQVASQTLDNINAVSYDINLPVFRPLTTYNKEDIVQLAKRYGTYEMSIKDYKDCCSLTSKNPLTIASIEKVKEFEQKIGLNNIIDESLKKMTIRHFSR